MVASKGGISYDRAKRMTRSQAREIGYGLAMAHGADINWETGKVLPPQSVQDDVKSYGGFKFSE